MGKLEGTAARAPIHIDRAWVEQHIEELRQLLTQDPIGARREIQKHVEDLQVAPEADLGERVVRITGRLKATASSEPRRLSAYNWLRGLDLNQRPLGYEGKSALHTDQKEPIGTNSAGDLRGGEVVPCWFVSVGLLHRDFIAVRIAVRIFSRSLVQDVSPYMIWRTRPLQTSLVEVKLRANVKFPGTGPRWDSRWRPRRNHGPHRRRSPGKDSR